MIGLLIVTHLNIGHEFIKALSYILGPQDHLEALSIDDQHSSEIYLQSMRETIKRLNQGKGVIIMTDMFGGSPSNLAFSFLKASEIEVIAGVNLPLLIKICEIRTTKSLNEVIPEAVETAKKHIQVGSLLLQSKSKIA
jgi:mannose PTS system EIIA component